MPAATEASQAYSYLHVRSWHWCSRLSLDLELPVIPLDSHRLQHGMNIACLCWKIWHTQTHIHTQICVRTCIAVDTHIPLYFSLLNTQTCTNRQTHACTWTSLSVSYTHAHTHTHTHTHSHTHTHTHTHTRTHTGAHTQVSAPVLWSFIKPTGRPWKQVKKWQLLVALYWGYLITERNKNILFVLLL